MRARTLLFAATLLSTQAAGCFSSNEAPPLNFEAKAGQPCTPCDTCTTTAKTCVCDTCTDYARDAVAKTLLVCTKSGWTVYRKCPGGVSVACTSGGYANSCLDENGNEIR